ncbi:cation diffusion facilitator family transporter [Amycolatopsis roodepoortensis]|uniref:cation diffusion facilitator family transporter n=1 Tax=Amycolatopsis roodepoortensis TaxID=700274 RepID=UPI00214CA149|nr:cation diffusion facilitator family transporter [Amycolatopsis roodepoortensis]UUV28680.1 cation diffusion facilitator family transporter [Amycolatopsis roodepoortensis]
MGQGHGHGLPPAEAGSASGRYVRRLAIAIGLGLVTFVIQLVVGLNTSSLALLSDSAHVFTDVFGVAMALVAILVARRAVVRSDRTYGMYRAEVFAALFNAVLLFAVAGWVLYEAVGRLADPPEVPGLPVTLVAVVGLAMNVAALLVLKSGAKESLNVRGAYLEVLADMLGSVGVLLSGLITLLFGWRYADPVIGVAIGLFVLPRAYNLGRHALRILFQHAPPDLDVVEVSGALSALAGVRQVHDLHVWTLTSGMEVASAHLTIDVDIEPATVLAEAQQVLADKFGLRHATLQVESPDLTDRCQRMSW